MDDEAFYNPTFASLIIANSSEIVDETAQRI